MTGRALRPCGPVLVLSLLPLFPAAVRAEDPATFHKDIAPLIRTHCLACHHDGGDAPFSLATYADVRRRASQIVAATASRYMPPWKPEPGTLPLVGSRRLSDAEVAAFDRWRRDGYREGAATAAPRPDRAPSEWPLGPPDQIVALPEYELPAEGTDVFRNFVVNVPTDAVRHVRGWHFRPRNRAIHHANVRIDTTAASRRLDAEDPAPGYEGLILHSAEFPDGQFLGWTPGQMPPLSADVAWTLPRGADLVVQLHMQATGKRERIAPVIGLYFTDTPPPSPPTMIRLGRQDLRIAPGDRDHHVRDSYVLPVDVQLMALQPHSHSRARSVDVAALLPNGTRLALLRISDWDFRWQDQYHVQNPPWLPARTRLEMEYVFDNSTANARNPDVSPREVEWGWRTSDEMADVWVQARTRSDSERRRLATEIRGKMVGEDVIGGEGLIARDPTHVSVRNDTALLYLELGRPADALRHFTAVRELQPDSASAYYNEGVALEAIGNSAAALARYDDAIRLRPAYSEAHNNRGSLLARTGDVPAAIAEFQRAIAADLANVDARMNLGSLLASSDPLRAAGHFREAITLGDRPEARCGLAGVLVQIGEPAEATRQYRTALTQRPELTACLVGFAWLLSAHSDAAVRRPQEAIAMAEQARALTPAPQVPVLDVLAAAYASAGRFDDAAAVAQVAVALARSSGNTALAAIIEERLALYRQRRPFIVVD